MHWRLVLVIGGASALGLLGVVLGCGSFGSDGVPSSDVAEASVDGSTSPMMDASIADDADDADDGRTLMRACRAGHDGGPTCGAFNCDFATEACCVNDPVAQTDAGGGSSSGGSSGGSSGIATAPYCDDLGTCIGNVQTCLGPKDCADGDPSETVCCAQNDNGHTLCDTEKKCTLGNHVCVEDEDCPRPSVCVPPGAGKNFWHCGACH